MLVTQGDAGGYVVSRDGGTLSRGFARAHCFRFCPHAELLDGRLPVLDGFSEKASRMSVQAKETACHPFRKLLFMNRSFQV